MPQSVEGVIKARLADLGDRPDALEQERRLWGAVDPEGKLSVPAGAIRSRARAITETMGLQGPEEAEIFGRARNLPNVARFQDAQDLVSSLSAELRKKENSPQARRRMTQLRETLLNVACNAAARQSAVEAEKTRRERR